MGCKQIFSKTRIPSTARNQQTNGQLTTKLLFYNDHLSLSRLETNQKCVL
uniref:Uncharacterized protein n=1 Tax=Anguilla anguilla TaxID=7936 RepID=A0A0E9SCB4_ANGAN